MDKNHSEAVKVFDTYKRNFVVQEVAEQHSVSSELNSSSLNTIRIISFNFETFIYFFLRLGAVPKIPVQTTSLEWD